MSLGCGGGGGKDHHSNSMHSFPRKLKKDTMKPIVTHARDRELTAACNSTTKRYFKIAFQSFV